MLDTTELKQLAQLRDTGILSEAEFEIEKNKILNTSHPSQVPTLHQPHSVQPNYNQQRTVIVPTNQPSVVVAYVLWFFLGPIGVHHLYMGRGVGVFLLALITFQGLGFLWIIDLFLIPSSCSKVRNSQTIIMN